MKWMWFLLPLITCFSSFGHAVTCEEALVGLPEGSRLGDYIKYLSPWASHASIAIDKREGQWKVDVKTPIFGVRYNGEVHYIDLTVQEASGLKIEGRKEFGDESQQRYNLNFELKVPRASAYGKYLSSEIQVHGFDRSIKLTAIPMDLDKKVLAAAEKAAKENGLAFKKGTVPDLSGADVIADAHPLATGDRYIDGSDALYTMLSDSTSDDVIVRRHLLLNIASRMEPAKVKSFWKAFAHALYPPRAGASP